MKKIVFLLTFIVCILLMFITVTADGIQGNYFTVNGVNYWIEKNASASEAGWVSVRDFEEGVPKNLTIPSTVTNSIYNYTVVEIRAGAFLRADITSVTIPETVPLIGEKAFAECPSLTTVVLPSNVSDIAFDTFIDCKSLTNINLNNVESIGRSAFQGCSALASVTFTDKLRKIDSYAFTDCTSLASVTLPPFVHTLGIDAFMGCTSLKTVSLPTNLTVVEYGLFQNCTALERVTIPQNVTKIYDFAFYNCSALISVSFDNANGIKEIESYAFAECALLWDFEIPPLVKSIGDGAFYKCTHLLDVTIPAGLTTIENRTFYECSSIDTVTIPKGITRIEEEAFTGCSSLETLTFETGSQLEYIGKNAFMSCFADNSVSELVIPEGVTHIDASAFYDCRCIGLLKLPNSIKRIGAEAFSGVKKLNSVSLPEGIEEIGPNAFRDCGEECENSFTVIFRVSTYEMKEYEYDKDGNIEKIYYSVPFGSDVFPAYANLVISGGSVNLPRSSNVVGTSGQRLYLVKAYLGSATYNSASGEWKQLGNRTYGDVVALLDDEGKKIPYNLSAAYLDADDEIYMTSTYTDMNGRLYLWLPEGTTLGAIRVKDNPDGTLTTTYNCEDGALTVSPTGYTSGNFYTQEYMHNLSTRIIYTEGTTPPPAGSLVLRAVNYDNKEITSGNGRCGLRIEKMPEGYSLIGLDSGPEIGEIKIDDSFDFTARGSDGYDIYRFALTSDTTLYAVIAQTGYNTVRTEILNETLPTGKTGEFYGFHVDTIGVSGSLSVTGLPEGVQFYPEFNFCVGVPIYAGEYTVTITLTEDGKEPIVKSLPVLINGETLTINGGTGGETFTFYKGEQTPAVEFSVDFFPTDVTTFEWSAEGLPDGLSLAESTPDNKALITGTPTALSDVSDAKIIVTATGADDKHYRGILEIKVKVEEKQITHTLTLVPAVEPTVAANGNIAYYVCSVCGEWFFDADGNEPVTDPSEVVVTYLGFATDAGGKKYYSGGAALRGWQEIDGDWYYFLKGSGYAVTGDKSVGGVLCSFDADGIFTGWAAFSGGKRYYPDGSPLDGAYLRGWQQIDGDVYYFLQNGGYAVTGDKSISGVLCSFDADGKLTGWAMYSGGKRYYPDGTPLDSAYLRGWQQIDGDWYYFVSSNGGFAAVGDKTIGGVSYNIDENGVFNGTMKNGLVNEDGGIRYYKFNVRQTGWQDINEKSYYFYQSTGFAATENRFVGGVYCCFDENGVYREPRNGFITDGDGTRYYKNDFHVTGWRQIEGGWYYFYVSTGLMVTESRVIGGVRYDIAPDGKIAR